MKVLVVGAGPAGLATALGLVERGIDVTVVDRASEVGGRMRTLHERGYAIELGPAGILDDAPDTRELLRRLGPAAPRTIVAGPEVSRRYLLREGKLQALPTSPLSFLVGGALRASERIAILREPFVPRARPSGETVAAFAKRRFGASLARALAQPMVVGVFGGDYEALEMESAFPRVAELEAAHGSVLRGMRAEAKQRRAEGRPRARLTTFAGGMGALPRAIASQLGDRVRLSTSVLSIVRGDRPSVRLSDGTDPEVDHVVLAAPPDDLLGLVGGLDQEIAALLGAIPSAAIASVSLAWHRAALRHPLDGFGLLVPRGEGKKTIGVLFMTSIFPTAAQAPAGEVLLRVMMGGPNDPLIHDLDDTRILEVARTEVGALLGATMEPTFAHLQRWPRAIPQYTVGHVARVRALEERLARHHISVVGTALHGIGVNDVLRDAARLVERLVSR